MKDSVKIIRCALIPVMTVSLFIMCACSVKINTADNPQNRKAEKTPVPVTENIPEEDTVRKDSSSYELMEYFGQNMEDVADDFPALEISVNEGIYDKGGTQYIDRDEEMNGMLAGPSFDADSDQNVAGIEYSGTRHSLNGLTKGMSMKDAADALKADGWTFSDADLTHGTSQILAIYEQGDMEICIVSDAQGEFGHTEEGDIEGNVDIISVSRKRK